jgi:hypothetical protein
MWNKLNHWIFQNFIFFNYKDTYKDKIILKIITIHRRWKHNISIDIRIKGVDGLNSSIQETPKIEFDTLL